MNEYEFPKFVGLHSQFISILSCFVLRFHSTTVWFRFWLFIIIYLLWRICDSTLCPLSIHTKRFSQQPDNRQFSFHFSAAANEVLLLWKMKRQENKFSKKRKRCDVKQQLQVKRRDGRTGSAINVSFASDEFLMQQIADLKWIARCLAHTGAFGITLARLCQMSTLNDWPGCKCVCVVGDMETFRRKEIIENNADADGNWLICWKRDEPNL